MPSIRRPLAAAVLLVAALSVVPAAPASAAGIGDWRYNAVTRHTYGLTDPMPWVDAEALAVRYGGHLVTINDQAEQDWLLAQFPDPYQWIGINDRAREGTWVWSSGQRVTFTAWQETQPDDWKGFDPLGEDAAALLFPDQPPGWVSFSGRWFNRGIVEIPGKPKAFASDRPPDGFYESPSEPVVVGDACVAEGWAFDVDAPLRDVQVRLLTQRTDIVQVPMEVWRGTAGLFRQDLLDAGIGDGSHGFRADLAPLIALGVPYDVYAQARDVETGEWTMLQDAPRALTCYGY